VSVQTPESIKDWSVEYQNEYHEWCWYKDYGDCSKCILGPEKKEELQKLNAIAELEKENAE